MDYFWLGIMSNWDSNYDFSNNQSQGFYDPQMYNYDAGSSDYSASNTVQQQDGKFIILTGTVFEVMNKTYPPTSQQKNANPFNFHPNNYISTFLGLSAFFSQVSIGIMGETFS